MRETHEKHYVSGYIQHFSQKYHDAVLNKLAENKTSPHVIREAVEKYDAAHMTTERLEAV